MDQNLIIDNILGLKHKVVGQVITNHFWICDRHKQELVFEKTSLLELEDIFHERSNANMFTISN